MEEENFWTISGNPDWYQSGDSRNIGGQIRKDVSLRREAAALTFSRISLKTGSVLSCTEEETPSQEVIMLVKQDTTHTLESGLKMRVKSSITNEFPGLGSHFF
jgi:hypothetical protein